MATGGGGSQWRAVAGSVLRRLRRPRVAAGVLAVVLVVTGIVVADAVGDSSDDGGNPKAAADSATRTTSTTVAPTTSTSAPVSASAAPLGEVRVLGRTSTRCVLDECLEVEVRCSAMPAAVATVAIRSASGNPTGVVVLFSGARGTTFWANPAQGRQAAVVDRLVNGGLEVVEVAWGGDGWGAAPVGQAIGFQRLACRPATLARWLHDQRYVPLGLDPPVGACGFCLSGNSGGASEVAYSLANYGLDSIIDAAVMTSGPPHGDILRGCRGGPADAPYTYGRTVLPYIDSAYGVIDGPGPCATSDPAFTDLFAHDGVATGGTDYRHDRTRIVVILGGLDPTVAPAHARLYVDRLKAAGTRLLDVQELATMEHEVLATAESRDAVVAALLGAPG